MADQLDSPHLRYKVKLKFYSLTLHISDVTSYYKFLTLDPQLLYFRE